MSRALAVSIVVHGALLAMGTWALAPDRGVTLVDVEIAPPPPAAEALPEEHARPDSEDSLPPTAMASAAEQATPAEPGLTDAGVDAPPIADATPSDAPSDAGVDAPSPDDAQPATVASNNAGSGSGSGSDSGSGSSSGSAGSGSGAGSDSETLPAVDGAPTTAGTAANLLTYFPKGHIVTALVRFDRLRNTEWAAAAESLLRPLPDYIMLFGDRNAGIADRFDTIVVSTPRPKDAAATTLVVHTTQSRAQIRDFLATPAAPITWSSARGGMLGRRKSPLANDTRVVLSPWRGWFLLAPAADFGDALVARKGNLDAIEATGKLPAWLDGIRAIEAESGDPRGPALVATFAATRARWKVPGVVDVGVKSLPLPERASLAMELVKQGWLVRGNLLFATEADAAEFVQAVQTARQHVIDSRVLTLLVKQQHAFAAIDGLSFARSGVRVSYATSVSIADARALLAALAVTVTTYFASRSP